MADTNQNNNTQKSVWSDAADNAYTNVTVGNNTTQKTERTRIYMYQDKTIELDEMSMVINNDASTNKSTNSTSQEAKSTEEPTSNYSNQGTTLGDKTMSIGYSYPLIRINDHYYTHLDIKKCVIETKGFIPTIELLLCCANNDIAKDNLIGDGDICSVFINPGHGMLKSYRADYIINSTMILKQDQKIRNSIILVYITGELYVPSLYNSDMTFSFAGSSRDALLDAATKLGLGFYFCDPENTNDTQMWYSVSDGTQKETSESPALLYLKNVSSHAWKNFNSFFDTWIDPRYGLAFININKMLGEDGLDEPIDVAFFNNIALSTSRGNDGNNSDPSDLQKKDNPRPLLKVLSNIPTDIDATTAFYIDSWQELNDGGNINKELGLNVKSFYDIKNTGVKQDESNVDMQYSIPTNATKLKNGFYILAGPGTNKTYKLADNGSYVELHSTTLGGLIADTQSDSDAEAITANGNNMTASGNTNKFYETAEGHNLLNNKWLQKKMIEVVLNGCNMQIMRGEKIPMIVVDHLGSLNYLNIDLQNALSKKIFETCTGWFIIHSMAWIYDATNPDNKNTAWRTKVILTRREWPIIGFNKPEYEAEITTTSNPNTGTTKNAANEPTTTNITINNEQTTNSTTQSNLKTSKNYATTEGLKDFILDIYNTIKRNVEAKNGSIILVSGRRWAADDNDNRIEGEPIIKTGELYKFINTTGNIVYYSSKTSKHLYGEAFDIINGQGTTFESILDTILSSNEILAKMLENGVYVAKEATLDDTGNNVEHYHIGTVDTTNSSNINAQATWWQSVISVKKLSMTYNGKTYAFATYLKYNK